MGQKAAAATAAGREPDPEKTPTCPSCSEEHDHKGPTLATASSEDQLREGAVVALKGLRTERYNGEVGVAQAKLPNNRWSVALRNEETKSFHQKNLRVLQSQAEPEPEIAFTGDFAEEPERE